LRHKFVVRAQKKTHGAPLVPGRKTLSLNAQGELTLVVVADTHSNPHPKTAQRLSELAPDAILHAGDIGDLRVLEDLGELAPVIAVRGNIDERANDLHEVVTIDVQSGGESALKMLLMHIAVHGPRIRADAAKLANEQGAKLIVCGHSHVPFVGRDRGLTVFNPGSIGPRRMHLPILFGVLQIKDQKLSLRHVEAETGQDWLP
jgi:putative phosphoesterase